MRVMRAVLMACIIFLLAHQCSVRLTSTFLGPQRDQGKRSKPAAGALPTSPEKRPTEVMDEQNQSWKAVENAVWNVISLAFWVVFFRAIVVEDMYLKHEAVRNAAVVEGIGGTHIPMFPQA
eukprot:CAMPEP_0181473204 /NCGR_PEP_ID=MMETSP1110-20121109/40002_1 /TAXON_ID=174948 /ORGANISM="Symbiodinium sp., Strain CCMP421" /LENGTH=120 /DNA_ID=CAMNT_0023598311 /DNA_START=57 /DNA_END=419 /DNA_ORIENTATION=-